MASEESTSCTPDTEGEHPHPGGYIQQNSETMLPQEQLVVSLGQVSQSIIECLDTPLRVQGGGDEQLVAIAEVVPMTLDRQPGVDAVGVRRDLGSEMALVARLDCCSISRHDARPPLLETFRTAREFFPRAYASLGILGDSVPILDTASLEPQERHSAGRGEVERGNHWSLLSLQPVAGQLQSTETSVVRRRLYDPEVGGTGYQVCVNIHLDQVELHRQAGRLGPG
jgi:hypothetical protein